MKINSRSATRNQQGSIIAVLIMMLIVMSALAMLAAYTMNTVRLASRRSDMIAARNFAQGGAVLAGVDLQAAYTNRANGFVRTLEESGVRLYKKNYQLSTAYIRCYERTNTTSFSNQNVLVQIWFTNSSSPNAAKIVSRATVGGVTQTATLNYEMEFGYAAAIICDSPGNTSTSTGKNMNSGNVCVNGSSTKGPIVVDGGLGLAILCNGRANVDTAQISPSSISMTNYGTANQVPDYTVAGSADQLFDFNRFIATAQATPPGAASWDRNYFTNLASFGAAISNANGAYLEGVVVVNIKKSELGNGSTGIYPGLTGGKPINIRGTLLVNFAADVGATDKIFNTCEMNINPAPGVTLASVNPTNVAGFTSGYPPVFANPAKDPRNVDLTTSGFSNFGTGDDLPAIMYNIGVLDIHGPVNVCGVLYTPSFVEIENKGADHLQYFKGSVISGGGVYFENTSHTTSKSIISFDGGALDNLATSSNKGKQMTAAYWE